MPARDFIVPVFSLIALSFFLIIYNKKIYKNNLLVYKLLIIFFIFQYIQAWGRSRYWLIIAITFFCIKTLFDSNKLKFDKSHRLLISIIFSTLTILNITEFIRINRRIFIRQRKFENNLYLDFRGTNLSFFKIKENTNWGISNDVVQVAKLLKSKLENNDINTYSYFDDNAFLIPLITGTKPIQNFTFFQLNKTIFKSKIPSINKFNLGRPDNLIICLPFNAKYFQSDPNTFLKNQLNLQYLDKEYPINFSERYIRTKKKDPNFEEAKNIFLSFTDVYLKNYSVVFSNDRCVIYAPRK